MSQTVSVCFLPSDVSADRLDGGVAVVVDILRASTTITTALANGACSVLPCETVEQAFAAKESANSGSCLLGGERGGVRIEGFDLSNSPSDYSRSVVEDRMVAFSTTNGTRALLKCTNAAEVLVGAFVNLSAVANRASYSGKDIHIVCAGTDGRVTGEDVLFAGALAQQISDLIPSGVVLADSAQIAVSHWKAECGASERTSVESALRQTQGGRNLIRLGFDADIGLASNTDTLQVIAILRQNGQLERL